MLKHIKPNSILFETLIALSVSIVVFILFLTFDLTEQWFVFTRDHEEFELDEIIGLVFGLLASLLYTTRRLLGKARSDKKKIYSLSREMEVQAYTDYLTKLPNRRAFEQQTRDLIGEFSQSKTKFTLMYIDLDSFKYINDTLGHSTGDKLLVDVSRRLSDVSDQGSLLYRIGGDEFCLIFPGRKSIKKCQQLCHDLNAKIAKPFLIEGQKLYISQTIGISRFPEDGESFEQLLKIADIAMYMGKAPGRLRNNFNDRDFVKDMQRRFIIQHGLREAITKHQLYIEYQPKVKLGDNSLIGSEALVRWNHPEHGFIPPDQFIYIAEEAHVVRMIDFYVLERVCLQVKEWGRHAKPVAVNLSPLLFADENLAIEIMAMLKKHAISPDLIELEITERTIVADSDIPLRICKALVAQGISISLDDFGTGYSSLSHIADFPVSTLKIDRAFITPVCENNKTRNIVSAIIRLADALSIKVIAEGIETFEQSQLMTELGCDEAQGYYFGRPLSVGDFTQHLVGDTVIQE